MTQPGLLSPARLDPKVLHDTEHALQNLEGCAALKQALQDMVGQFNDLSFLFLCTPTSK